MILSDRDIRDAIEHGELRIEPLGENAIQPASVDLHLGNRFIRFDSGWRYLWPEQDNTDISREIECEAIAIEPGEFVLAETREWVSIPDELVARIEGKSSLARLGLLVHVTAGFVDPGFEGTLTLEIANVNRMPVFLRAGMPIAQLAFMCLTSPAERPYGSPGLGSKYQGQQGPTPSRYHLNFVEATQ